jgi:hypothetical protein
MSSRSPSSNCRVEMEGRKGRERREWKGRRGEEERTRCAA